MTYLTSSAPCKGTASLDLAFIIPYKDDIGCVGGRTEPHFVKICSSKQHYLAHVRVLSSPLLLSVLLIYFFLYHFTARAAPWSGAARAANTCFDALCNECLPACLRWEAVSHASTLQVVDHLLDDQVGGLVILESSVAVLALLGPEAHHDASHSFADAGTATAADQLGEAILVVGKHVLLATHADASLRGRSVATGGLDSAQDLVHFNLLNAAIHVFQVVSVCLELGHVRRNTPNAAILSVDASSTANVVDGPVVGVVIEAVLDLLSVSVPVRHAFLCLFQIDEIYSKIDNYSRTPYQLDTSSL